ncbi:hypothetical protein ABT173_17475 [Streptomyces sp. NPDC001795]|uniref:hypothetical protein n=1 Tax=Streptomyces sp. NPDC001795 TaxID=3154525 RepID=UPI00332F9E67
MPPAEGRSARSDTTEYMVLLLGTFIVGFAISFQTATDDPHSVADQLVSGVALAVGGGILGAGINSLIVKKYERDVLAEVTVLLAESLQARFTSTEAELASYRRNWHHYYLTEVDRELTWWYEKCSFDHNPVIGSIVQRTALHDTLGRTHTYVTEMGVRGQRLVLLETREDGAEAAGVEVYPMPRGFRSVHAGVACVETWDGTHLIGKAILSESPIVDSVTEGRIQPEHAPVINEVWAKLFQRNIRIVLEPDQADST